MLKAPFPYFGGKSRVASIVWAALGDVYNYIEPFCGSCAVFLARPHPHKIATLNDKNGLIVNFWRALKHAPEEVAKWAAWPVSEIDIMAMHSYIFKQVYEPLEGDPLGRTKFVAKLEGDIDYYDARVAGYWVYGMSSWIGNGWCSDKGPWIVDDNNMLVYGENNQGITRGRPHLGWGKGINRSEIFLKNAQENTSGKVIFNQKRLEALIDYFNELAEVLSVAKITCGDWKRVCGPAVTYTLGLTGIFFDPPYGHPDRDERLYGSDDKDIAKEVREYCLEHGNRTDMRIVLAGYEGEGHEELEKYGWKIWAWKGGSAYSSKNSKNQINRLKERLWFSPSCIGIKSLF